MSCSYKFRFAYIENTELFHLSTTMEETEQELKLDYDHPAA
jgi:hypothetical protein